MFAQVALSLAASLVAAAQSSSTNTSTTVVCIAGQCLQGVTNTTLGATLSGSGSVSSIRLLPGQYTSSTDPQLLHNLLTSSKSSLSAGPGFDNASLSLPMDLALQPGMSMFQGSLYSGESQFVSLPTTPAGNTSASATPISAGSLVVASNVWVALNSGSSSNRIVLWDSVPDVSQLPTSALGSLSLLDIQSSSCSPPCSGNGVCSAKGQCTCPPGFTGSSCESCATGFFGPSCQACPADCDQCDEGIAGSGTCLKRKVDKAPSTCNCLNGQCGSDGSCTCNAGWTNADNGTACAKCASGFFLTSSGDCQVCQLGCTSCADGTGTCLQCKQGFTQNANDKTQCLAQAGTTTSGTVCPDGSFSDGTACKACSPSCKTCSGPTSNDCIICGNGQYKLGDNCVGTDGNGVCEGSTLIANNNKHECDACPSKCTGCKLPNFNVASTIDQLQCTGCLPGSFLSNGKCVESCPTGTFVGSDGFTCSACDSSCSTCAGSATFCLTCANSKLASNGTCVNSCPSSSFSSSDTCVKCHPDCATCSGSAFNQCSSCPPNLPLLTNGRCLPTCSKGQYFDKTSSTCQSCDSSCSSCSGPGPSSCLACSKSDNVLKAGACVSASCTDNTTVLQGFGVCLSDLVVVPKVVASGTTSALPLPTVSGINTPTKADPPKSGPLPWWQILLMALGCAFIFLVFLLCWRRRARRQRLKRTQQFAVGKALLPRPSWRERVFSFFGRRRGSPQVGPVHLASERESIQLEQLRMAEEARHHQQIEQHNQEMEKMAIFGAYQYSQPGSIRSSRALNDEEHLNFKREQRALFASDAISEGSVRPMSHHGSIFTQMTGEPRRGPDPRQPAREGDLLGLNIPGSRMSGSIYSSSSYPTTLQRRPTSPAQAYARQVREDQSAQPQLLQPQLTGTSGMSRETNPFRTGRFQNDNNTHLHPFSSS